MKLTFENPTVRSTGKVQSFINELKKHPNKWAVYSRTAKHFSYFSGMSSKSDNLVISVRQNQIQGVVDGKKKNRNEETRIHRLA